MLVFSTAEHRYSSLYRVGDLFLVQFVRFEGQVEVVCLKGDKALLRDFEPCFLIDLKTVSILLSEGEELLGGGVLSSSRKFSLYYLLAKDEHYFQTNLPTESQSGVDYIFY